MKYVQTLMCFHPCIQLTDLSSISSTSDSEAVQTHRRFSSTSYILKTGKISEVPHSGLQQQVKTTPTSLSIQYENTSDREDMGQFPHTSISGTVSFGEDEATSSSRKSGGHRKSPTHHTKQQTLAEEASPPSLVSNQYNGSSESTHLSKLNEQDGLTSMSVGNVLQSRSIREKAKTQEELVADMQADIEQLLHYTQVRSHVTC